MTDQENINHAVQVQIAAQNARIELQNAKIDAALEELKQQRQDIRDLNKKVDDKFDKLSEQIHSMTITAIIGFGAILVAVGGLIIAVLK